MNQAISVQTCRKNRTRGGNVLKLFIFLGIIAWTTGFWEFHTANAQAPKITWSAPVRLSDPEIQSWSPAIVADRAGGVHMMWSQTMTRNPVGEGDTLFYSHWDGTRWSVPVDVLVSPEGSAEFPDLAITPDGMLHAVWGTAGIESKLMYAKAPACCAGDPRNWSAPMVLGQSMNLTPALVADDRGSLYIMYASLETSNIVFLRSDDSGETWPVQVNVQGGLSQPDEYAAYPRLAVDHRGRVHAAWTVFPWPGRAVVYSRSDDGGVNWTEPLALDKAERPAYTPGYGPIYISVTTNGEDVVHLMWDGAPTVERTHVWSSDGGKTWSSMQTLFPEITGAGRAGWNDMVVDSTGMLHAVALKQPWYADWVGGTWSKSVDIGHMDTKAEWLRIALGLGNQLHVAWVRKTGDEVFSVWYVHGQADAPEIQPQPLVTPTAIPSPTLPATSTPELQSGGASGSLSDSSIQSQMATPSSTGRNLLISLLPGTAVILLVFTGKILLSRMRR